MLSAGAGAFRRSPKLSADWRAVGARTCRTRHPKIEAPSRLPDSRSGLGGSAATTRSQPAHHSRPGASSAGPGRKRCRLTLGAQKSAVSVLLSGNETSVPLR